MTVGAPDIVVPVREGAVNRQLRYALRSWAANLPHGRVWIVGYVPPWVETALHLPLHQGGTKYENTTAAVRRACEHSLISDPFVLCNDDFFVMHRTPEVPVLHRGPVREVEAYYAARASGAYLRGMRETAALLGELGHPDPLSYELHVPMTIDKTKMLQALDLGSHLDVVHKRTLYGNLAQLGGGEIADVKILHRAPTGYTANDVFLSTMPDSFANGRVGQHIRKRFPEPSVYERPGRY